jgi:acyl-CoA reductase-like NAD-dependent aldehyde dehydrogenase
MAATLAGTALRTGSIVRPTVLQGLPPQGEIARPEIFGPVLGAMPVDTAEEAIRLINEGSMATWHAFSSPVERTPDAPGLKRVSLPLTVSGSDTR